MLLLIVDVQGDNMYDPLDRHGCSLFYYLLFKKEQQLLREKNKELEKENEKLKEELKLYKESDKQ